MPVMSTERDKWISLTEAAQILGIDQIQARRIAGRGHLVRRTYPGTRPKVSRESVEQLAAGAIRPATTSA